MTEDKSPETQAAELAPNAPISFEEAAEIVLRGLVTARSLKDYARRGQLKAYKLGRKLVTTRDDVNDWMSRQQYTPPGFHSISSNYSGSPVRKRYRKQLQEETATVESVIKMLEDDKKRRHDEKMAAYRARRWGHKS